MLSFRKNRGFTIVELIIVIVVIGILAAVSIVAYNGVTRNAIENSVVSDADGVESLATRYTLKNSTDSSSALDWYSPQGANLTLDFTPSNSNIIDIVTAGNDFCIRVYNPNSQTYNSIFLSVKRESSPGACDEIAPSAQAVADGGGEGSKLVRSIATGYFYTCGVAYDSSLYCWGIGTDGQLGNGTTSYWYAPRAVINTGVLLDEVFVKFAGLSDNSTDKYTCIVALSKRAYCWGDNAYGQLGNNETTNSSVPVAVDTSGILAGKNIASLGISDYSFNTCALTEDNILACWGRNHFGQLGNNSTADSAVPVAVDTSGVLSGKTVEQLVVDSSGAVCTLTSDNGLYCWGSGTSGQLGNGVMANSSVPVAVDMSGVLAGKTVQKLMSKNSRFCALTTDSKLFCWGHNFGGKLGNNSTTNSSVPVAVDTSGVLSGKTIKSVALGLFSSCVVASDDKLYCWGTGTSGQLGNGVMANSSVPVAVDMSGVLAGKTIKTLQINSNQICVIASDSQLYCWGLNTYGQLGNNSTADSAVPVAVDTSGVLSGKTIKSVALGGYHGCAIASDNRAYCWGLNGYGQLGKGSPGNSSVPVLVTDFQ